MAVVMVLAAGWQARAERRRRLIESAQWQQAMLAAKVILPGITASRALLYSAALGLWWALREGSLIRWISQSAENEKARMRPLLPMEPHAVAVLAAFLGDKCVPNAMIAAGADQNLASLIGVNALRAAPVSLTA